MIKIIVQQPIKESLGGQFFSLYNVLKNIGSQEKIEFDLSNLSWLYPLLILPISAYINTTDSKYTFDVENKCHSYLNTIRFPNGVDSVSLFEQQIQQNKNYIPISVLNREKEEGRERLESLFSKMVYKILGSVQGAQSAVYYPITELVTNIFEHSKENKGFVFGQFYPKKNYLDICIVDRGRGLAKTYLEEKGLKLNDEDAIVEVMKGNSTKPDKERGFGVWTSKNIVCKAIGGQFVLVSGSAALFSKENNQKLVSLPKFYWQGVIIAYRIPQITSPIDITPYYG